MTAGIAANAIALVALLALVIWKARRPTDAVRLRNALLLEPSRDEDFTWVPPDFPQNYAVDRLPASSEFTEIVASLGVDAIPRDWDKALALAAHLSEHAEGMGPLRDDLSKTYAGIRRGYGYCADFVKVYLALARAAGLDARQWAFSFDGFGGHGHTVVEVFDRQRGKWLLLDVFNNFHVVDAGSGEPLGALEYRDALLGRRTEATMRPNGPGRPGFVHEHKALDYYRRGIDQWYLVWGNAVFSYYGHPAVKATGKVSRTLAHLTANLVGVQPRIRLFRTSGNAELVQRMFALRRWLLAMLGLLALLSATLVVQLLLRPGNVGLSA
jgi:hypothetical protein